MKSKEPLELMLLEACYWHLSLIQGNLMIGNYSRNAMLHGLWDNSSGKNNIQHLLLDTCETVLLSAIITKTKRFFKWLMNDEKQKEDQDNGTGTYLVRTFREAGISCFI